MEVTSMLVLSRRQSERIRVGENIIVTVVRVCGDRVRLGIEAPANMRVLRDELEPFPEGVATTRMTTDDDVVRTDNSSSM
jgi:carbon storage regulator